MSISYRFEGISRFARNNKGQKDEDEPNNRSEHLNNFLQNAKLFEGKIGKSLLIGVRVDDIVLHGCGATSTNGLTEHFVRIEIIEKPFIPIKFDCYLCIFIKFSKLFLMGIMVDLEFCYEKFVGGLYTIRVIFRATHRFNLIKVGAEFSSEQAESIE